MSLRDFERRVAAATGEDLSTIRGRGFSPLSFAPVGEECREPLVMDWEASASHYADPFPVRRPRAA